LLIAKLAIFNEMTNAIFCQKTLIAIKYQSIRNKQSVHSYNCLPNNSE